jgi:hypothetical protein
MIPDGTANTRTQHVIYDIARKTQRHELGHDEKRQGAQRQSWGSIPKDPQP